MFSASCSVRVCSCVLMCPMCSCLSWAIATVRYFWLIIHHVVKLLAVDSSSYLIVVVRRNSSSVYLTALYVFIPGTDS